MMRVKKLQTDTSLRSHKSTTPVVSQSLNQSPMLLKSATFEHDSASDSIGLKKRSGSFERARRDKILDEDDFSCGTS